jgi:hypothetical protein
MEESEMPKTNLAPALPAEEIRAGLAQLGVDERELRILFHRTEFSTVAYRSHQLCFLEKYAQDVFHRTFGLQKLAVVFHMNVCTIRHNLLQGLQEPEPPGRHKAINTPYSEIMQLLDQTGYDLTCNRNGKSLLLRASNHGDLRVVHALSPSQNRLLVPLRFDACEETGRSGQVPVVKEFLTNGSVDVNATHEFGHSLLWTAVCESQTPVVRVLLKLGADPGGKRDPLSSRRLAFELANEDVLDAFEKLGSTIEDLPIQLVCLHNQLYCSFGTQLMKERMIQREKSYPFHSRFSKLIWTEHSLTHCGRSVSSLIREPEARWNPAFQKSRSRRVARINGYSVPNTWRRERVQSQDSMDHCWSTFLS